MKDNFRNFNVTKNVYDDNQRCNREEYILVLSLQNLKENTVHAIVEEQNFRSVYCIYNSQPPYYVSSYIETIIQYCD